MNEEYFPLNNSQRGVYFECVEEPESTKYNVAFAVELPEIIDIAKFEAAVKEVILKYPAFSVTIDIKDGEPVMHLGKSKCEISYSKAESYEDSKKDFVKPFDLEKGPLYRIEICQTPSANVFMTDVHHLIFDGTSYRVLLEQISRVYDGNELLDETVSLFDEAKSEISLPESEEYAKAKNYFKEKYSEVEFENEIIPDIDQKNEGSTEGLLTALIDSKEIEQLAIENNVTKGTVFEAAFGVAVSVFAGTKDSSFVTGSSGRHNKPLDNTVGMFVKMFPLHLELPETLTISELLQQVQKDVKEAVEHDCISFSDLATELGIHSNIAFIYQSDLYSKFEISGTVLSAEKLPLSSCQSDLVGMVEKKKDVFNIRIEYDSRKYSPALIQSFLDTYLQILKGFMDHEYIKDIPLITDDTRKFIDSFNSTEKEIDSDITLNKQFERTAQKYSDKKVFVYKDKSYTYKELDQLSKNIAGFISSKNIGADDYVAVIAPRNDETIISAWGVVRAGAAYQPLDPTYPVERLNYMIRDSRAKLLITDRKYRDLVSDYDGDVLFTDEVAALPEIQNLSVEVKPENAAALIYTSGTTGNPKGCVLEHRNLYAFLHNYVDTLAIDDSSNIAAYASFGFDAGVMDVIIAPLTGAVLYIVPDEIRLDLAKVEEFYLQNKITHGFMTTQVCRMFAQITKSDTLKVLLTGGEKLVPFNPPENLRFINSYGPCETMAFICSYEPKDNSPIQPIGKPSVNTKLFIADKYGRLLPPGAPGELCISGLQVGRGYLNLPEKTEAAFVKNSFCDQPGYERMYKTGDVVRLLTDGNLDFIGRKDGQVKIRGFRVELTEVEEVIRRFDGIKDATVAAFDLPSGGKAIAAYVTSDSKIDISKLNAFIRNEKPDYMVPAVTMQIDAIPYNQNQKVNKRALPTPKRAVEDVERIAPQSEVQKQIFDIAVGILGNDDFGITTDLFEAGMTSVSSLQFNLELGKVFDKPIKISDIRKNSTVEELAEFISGQKIETVKEPEKALADQTDYPLMQNQLGVLLETNLNPDTVIYNIPLLMKISEKIDIFKLQDAIKTAINAHPYIKAVIYSDDKGEFRTKRNDDDSVDVEIIEIDKLPESEELIQPFDVVGGKLYRAKIFKTTDGSYMFLDIHHVVADGTSLGILLNDINAAYEGQTIEKEKFTGFDAALEEEQEMAADSYQTAKEYFDNLLSGCDNECLPAKCPEDKDDETGEQFTKIFDSDTGSIAEYCKSNKVTENAFFNAVFSYTLARFLHADDITYCTVYNGRNDSRLASCFSMLVKTLPVRVFIDTKSKTLDFVNSMQKQLMDSMSNDMVPFSTISNDNNLKADLFFIYQGDNFAFNRIGNEDATLIDVALKDTKAPLTIEVSLENGKYKALANYRKNYFCKEFVSSLLDGLSMAIEGFVKADSLDRISLLSDTEKSYFNEMNNTDKEFDKVPAHILFEREVDSHPDKIAVITRNTSLTFKQLDEKANVVANAIMSRGAKKGDIIGMILDRDENIAVCELGIMKAGCAFLPMIPSYPAERIEYCLKDSESSFVIATKDIFENHKEISAEGMCCKMLDIAELLEEENEQRPSVQIEMNDLAYCIYTSGSTGTPKGVMIEHHNLSCFTQTACLRATEERGNIMLCIASISFDMSISEIFFPLAFGNGIYIATEEEIHNLDMLLSAFEINHIDMMTLTPSFLWTMLSIPEFNEPLSKLKSIVVGAEAFSETLLTKLKAINKDLFIQNGYGPTECTICCSAKNLEIGDDITIGGPSGNMKFYIMDNDGNLLPRYAVGELIICGENVSRGYIKLPEKNAAAFFDIDGVPAYHSGDLAYITKNNEAAYIGRTDSQVKLRGFRVELGEIETVMQEFDGVSQSKVIVRNNGKEDYLAAFFTANKEIDVDELTAYLRSKLTYYMVPAAMMQLDKMPLTPNGKLDARSLPEITPQKKARSKRSPKRNLEEKIVDLIKTTLDIDEVYADDNFFEIGGTSLSASKVVMKLKSDGYKIEYQDIFDHQSAEELAQYLEPSGEIVYQAPTAEASDLVKQDERIQKLLSHNKIEFADEVERKPLGDLLLTGATGFLGMHILKAFLENEEGRVICILRKGGFDDVVTRLQAGLVYYFEDDCKDYFGTRIIVKEGDITDDNLCEQFKDIHFDTLINCAASVKHYANDNSIEFVNVHGVENLIRLAKEKQAKMIQISTVSVPGAHTDETYRANLKMRENDLFVIDDMNNQYAQSKYKAELLMLDAIEGGMRGKIIRVGNLMGRYSDGEFQTNMSTNAFLNGLRGFVNIGKSPISHSTDPMSFSPVDCTARAVVLLAGTNDSFTAFHAESRSTFDEAKLIEAVNRCNLTVTPVADKEYYDDFYRMMGDPEMNEKVSALLTNDRPDMHMVEADNRFTANVLYRLGFSWPFIDDEYLERVITSLDTLDFFFR